MRVVSTGDQKGVMIYFNSQQFKGVLEGRKTNAIIALMFYLMYTQKSGNMYKPIMHANKYNQPGYSNG